MYNGSFRGVNRLLMVVNRLITLPQSQPGARQSPSPCGKPGLCSCKEGRRRDRDNLY